VEYIHQIISTLQNDAGIAILECFLVGRQSPAIIPSILLHGEGLIMGLDYCSGY
jgi:hypothetical protein